MPLLKFWESTKDAVQDMTIQQIMGIAGDGQLKDGSLCSAELQEFLKQIDSNLLESYANYCLENSFTESGFVLQDIVNEVGRRLGFEITNGLYRGRPKQNNADGIWRSEQWSFVVEVKTTDAYSISLKKIANYLAAYESTEQKQKTSCLIVVGRKQTVSLEDQLRGSRHNWEMRIVGVKALFKALELKELSEDPRLISGLINLLKPQEFTRIDQILSVAFDFATDREDSMDFSLGEMEEEGNLVLEDDKTPPINSDNERIEKFKISISNRLKEHYSINLTRNRSRFESQPRGSRFAVAVSKYYPYAHRNYWYRCNLRDIKYLEEVDNGYFVLGCLDNNKFFVIPVFNIRQLVASDDIRSSPSKNHDEDKKYYHVYILNQGDRYFICKIHDSKEFDINEFEI